MPELIPGILAKKGLLLLVMIRHLYHWQDGTPLIMALLDNLDTSQFKTSDTGQTGKFGFRVTVELKNSACVNILTFCMSAMNTGKIRHPMARLDSLNTGPSPELKWAQSRTQS